MTSFLRKNPLITWFLTIAFTIVLTSACNYGWFGPLCQYKCHCTNNLCTTDGECQNGAQCEHAWFGPACQYEDLAIEGIVKTTPPSKFDAVTDGNSHTCLTNMTSLQLVWNTTYHFTWLRITGLPTVEMPSFHVSFKDSDQEPVNCTNQRNHRVDVTTVDIFCELNATVQELHIAGAKGSALDVCSLFVSGGLNFALKQHATQSGVWKEFGILHSAQLAVDGNRNNILNNGSCAHTESPFKGSARWEVTIARPSLVNRYVLYNRKRYPGNQNEQPSNRLKGFILKSFSEDGSQVFDYKDPSSEAKYVYTVVSASSALVSKVEITAVANDNEKVLELCEVEVHGEIICEDDWYGLNCSSKYLSDIIGAPSHRLSVDNTAGHSVPVVYMHILSGTSSFLLLIVLALVLIMIKTCKKSAKGLEAGKVHHVIGYCSYKSGAADNHGYLTSTENIDLVKDEHNIYSNPADCTFVDNRCLVDVPNQPADRHNNNSRRPAPYTTFPYKQRSLDAGDKNLCPTLSGFQTMESVPDEEVDDEYIYEN